MSVGYPNGIRYVSEGYPTGIGWVSDGLLTMAAVSCLFIEHLLKTGAKPLYLTLLKVGNTFLTYLYCSLRSLAVSDCSPCRHIYLILLDNEHS